MSGVVEYAEMCGLRWGSRVRLAVTTAVICLLMPLGAVAGPPQRVVSINACTDQLLLALGERSQIAALSYNASDEAFSYYADRARGLPLLRGTAEEVLRLKPDLVLGSTYTRAPTRARLQAFGLRLELLPLAQTVDDVRALIVLTAGILGQEERGLDLVAAIDRALRGARRSSRGLSALNLQRRRYVSGGGTLIDDLLQRLDVSNAARGINVSAIGRASLETVVKFRPDALVVFGDTNLANDQGNAVLLHPVLAKFFPPERRIVLAPNLILCGGPQVADAISSLSKAFEKISKRSR